MRRGGGRFAIGRHGVPMGRRKAAIGRAEPYGTRRWRYRL